MINSLIISNSLISSKPDYKRHTGDIRGAIQKWYSTTGLPQSWHSLRQVYWILIDHIPSRLSS